MLLLTSVNDKLQVVTNAAGTVKVHASWVDNASGVITPGRTNTAFISGAATTDVVAPPAASAQRNVKFLVVRNDHASVANGILIQHTDGTTIESIWEGTLAPQEQVVLDDRGTITYFDVNGIPKNTQSLYITTDGDLLTMINNLPGRFPAGADWGQLYPIAADPAGLRWIAAMGNSSIAAQGPGFAADTYLAGSNVLIPNGLPRVGTKYRCRFDMSKTAAGVATPIISLRIGPSGNITDTLRATLTFALQTAAIDAGMFDIVATFRSIGAGAAAVLQARGELRHQLSITGLSTSVSGAVFNTSAGFDSTPTGNFIGLSVNGGAAAVWTNQIAESELIP
jgi:hypothetical protein